DLLGDRGLAVRGLVLVHDALADGLVELLRRLLQSGLGSGLVAGGDGLTGLADEGLQLRLHGLVAGLSLLVGLVALDLRLDVCHAWKLSFSDGIGMCREQKRAAARRS